MGPFIIFGLLFYLVLIVVSVCAYPYICVCIAVAFKRIYGIVTGILLMLTIALYLHACTTLEHAFGNWCYSVYAGIALTPIVLFLCIGLELEQSSIKPESEEKIRHRNNTVSILTLFTSSLFAIEGVLRMAHSYSVHRLLNYGLESSEEGGTRLYYESFQYAGSLMFVVSILSALVIGTYFFINNKEYRHKLAVKTKVTQKLKADSDLLMSFESHQVDEAILYYNTFCQKIIAALESSDEKAILSYEYGPFNNINTSYKVLLLSDNSSSYYIYPVGIVVKNPNDLYKYITFESATISLKMEKKNKMETLPNDVQPLHQIWLHSCRDGRRDWRYNFNPMTYVYEYGILSVATLILNIYRIKTAKDVVSAYNKMYSYISQLKQQKHYDKQNVLSEEKATPTIITDNKESATKAEHPEETITSKQHVAIENPKTLEDCLSVIMFKHGTDILKDNKLVSIITTYKEIDISEYKDILDGMVRDNFLYQFIDNRKQNDFTIYNLSSSFARQKKVSVQKVMYITQALVTAIKKIRQ